MTDSPTPLARHPNGRFGPGNPGRPVGARNKLSHELALTILKDFEKNKDAVLQQLRNTYTPAYFAVLVRLMEGQLVEEPSSEDRINGD